MEQRVAGEGFTQYFPSPVKAEKGQFTFNMSKYTCINELRVKVKG